MEGEPLELVAYSAVRYLRQILRYVDASAPPSISGFKLAPVEYCLYAVGVSFT